MSLTYRDALGEVLRELRAERKMTLRKASSGVPMALGYLSEVERGHKELSSELLALIARHYKVPTSSIIIEAGVRLASWELPNVVPESFSEHNELRGGVLVR